MKVIFFIINLIISLYGTAPIFTTCEALPENREKQVYVTIDYGICLDDSGNGILYGYDSMYNYISYSKVESAKVGDEIYTFCILNPDTNDYDDIVCRIDVIANSNKIFIDMDDITNYLVMENGLQLNFDDGTSFYWEWE